MKPRKWSEVILNAQQKANLELFRNGPSALLMSMLNETFDWKKEYGNMQEVVWETIANWDIRRAKELCTLFPGIVAKDCTFTYEYNEKGEWVIF